MGGGLLREVVVGGSRVPHGEAVVVLGGDEQHLHAGVFGLLAPRGRVEVGGLERLGGGQVFIAGDALELPLRQTVKEQFSGLRPILCANLPYNITTPFLTACVEAQCFDSLTVLIQKEVAQRICAAPGTADYGAFTLLMQYYTQPELLFTVSNTCFLPAPKVTSAVIHCRSRKAPPVEVCSREMLFRTVRAGFALRRKTLVNSLQTAFPLPKERLTEIVVACGLDPSVRGERLGLAEYARLADALAAEKEG